MLRLLLCFLPALLAVPSILNAQNINLEVAPGVTLPSTAVVAVVENSGNQPKMTIIHAAELAYNSHAAENFARSVVYAGPKSGMQVAGQHASIQLHGTPTIYVRLASDDPETQRSRLTLLMLRVEKDHREVTQFSSNIFGGSRKRKTEDIAIEKTDVASSSWVKIIPREPLESGEYAIAFPPKDQVSFRMRCTTSVSPA